MSTIIVTGGSGLVGKALCSLLAANGHKVIILGRRRSKVIDESRVDLKVDLSVQRAWWDIDAQEIEPGVIEQADVIIHLAGAGVAEKRWSDRRKREIEESRTKSAGLLVKTLRSVEHHVKLVVSASAIGWYGPDPIVSGKAGFVESAPSYNDFLGQTCLHWEQSIRPVEAMGIRLVILRTGIVLSREGGALVEFEKPLKLGVAAILGSGDQVISWIHIHDLCRMYLAAIQDPALRGVYNAVGPAPVSNKTLTLALAKRIRRSLFIPVHVPSFVLKLVMGEMSIEVLKSTTVSSSRIQASGFQFAYPTVDAALAQLYPPSNLVTPPQG